MIVHLHSIPTQPARVGHCKIPQDYPDGHLRRWLVQQQDLIHCYSTGQTTDLLPAQLKMLQAIGVHGCKRLIDTTPKPSSRTHKRKFPSKRDKKRGGDSDKLKSSSPRKNPTWISRRLTKSTIMRFSVPTDYAIGGRTAVVLFPSMKTGGDWEGIQCDWAKGI